MDKLTKNDQEFVKEVAITGNATQAVKKIYKTRKTDGSAREKGSTLLTNPNIVNAIEEVKKSLADRIPDELLQKVHLEGLEAGEKIVKDGRVLIEIPDYSTRHKYLDSAYKLKGSYAPEKSINLNVNAEITNPKAKELADKYEQELKQNL